MTVETKIVEFPSWMVEGWATSVTVGPPLEAGFTVRVSCFVAVCVGEEESVTVTVTVKVPLTDGTHVKGFPVEPLHPAGRPE